MNKFPGNTIFYTLLLAVDIALVWLLPYFPTQDGPSHIYNLVILHDLLNGGKEWGDLFTYELRATPNLGFHLIAYPLLLFFHPLVVEKLFISLYLILMGVSIPVFLKTFSGKIFPFAYFVFPVMFNFCLMMGFYSYVITVPLFLLAVSASWKIRNYPVPQKILSFNAMGIVLFYFHLIPAVLYIMSLAIMDLIEYASFRSRLVNTLKLAGVMAPWFIIFSLYMWRSFSLSGHPQPITHISDIDLSRDFFSFSTVIFDPLQQVLAAILLFLILFFFSVSLSKVVKGYLQKRTSLSDIPRQKKFLFCFLISLIFIYFFAPFNLGDGSFFNQRFPWIIFLFTLPLLQFPERVSVQCLCSIVLATVALMSIALNFRILSQQSIVVRNFLRGTVADINKGAYVMLYRDGNSDWSRADVLLHAVSHYGMEKKCVDIGNYEVSYNIFPVKYKRKLPSIPAWDKVEYEPETIRWDKYPSIDYLIAWKADLASRREIGRFFHIIWEDKLLTIWQRNTRIKVNMR